MDILFRLNSYDDKATNFTVAGALYEACKVPPYDDLDPETIARMILQQCEYDRFKPNEGERCQNEDSV